MYPFTMGLQMMSFFLATLSPTLKSANAVSYAIVLLAIVVQAFTSDYTLISFLFTVDASTFVMILRTVLVFYPPFNYTKVAIILLSSLHT